MPIIVDPTVSYPALDPNYFMGPGYTSDAGAASNLDTAGGTSTSPFVAAAEAFVGTFASAGAAGASAFAVSELPGAISAAFSIGTAEGAIIGTAAAIGDVAAFAFTGTALGGGAGVVLLAPFAAGYAVGTYIIDPLLGL